jgi:hypothetical protein
VSTYGHILQDSIDPLDYVIRPAIVFGSEGWGFESLRARQAMQGISVVTARAEAVAKVSMTSRSGAVNRTYATSRT